MNLIEVERRGSIELWTFNRPEARNPLGAPGDGDEIAAACERVNRDSDVRCIIYTGAGSAFSAGGDVKAMQQRSGAFAGRPAELRESYRHGIHKMMRAFHGLEIPAIAAVNGPAIGLGCDVACVADMRIASEKARFGVTFLKIGLIPGDGGAWILPRVIGMSRASELLFTGEVIDARTAEQWGLVSRVVPHERLLAEAFDLAGRVAQQPRHALRMGKMLLRQGGSASYDTLLEMSAMAQAISHWTDDHEEGVAAMLEKRAPRFSG